MNRTSISVAATLVALAAAGPAQAAGGTSDTQLALRYSAEASVTLRGAPSLADNPTPGAQRHLRVAMSTAQRLEIRAATAARRSLNRGRQSTRAAVSGATLVISRLNADAHTEAAVLRSSSSKPIQALAATGIELNATLTSSLDAQLAGVAVAGRADASISASAAIARRSPAIVGIVGDLVRTLPSADSIDTRAHLDSALAVVIRGSGFVEAKLVDARDQGDDAQAAAANAAVDATHRANSQIKALIDASGAASHEVRSGQNHGANANANANATVTLGEIASGSGSVAANAALESGGKR